MTPPVVNTTTGGTLAPFLYNNGPFITGTGNGVGGADTSSIEATFNTYGYGCQQSVGNRVADDFVVPAGQNWTLSKLHWRSYQTGAPTTGTINGIQVNIWNATPTTGGTPLWSSAANVFVSKTWTNVYRVISAPGDAQRAIQDVIADLTGSPVLGPGTYWVDVSLTGTLASGPWSNPTVPHAGTDNGRQFTTAGGWAAIIDATAGLPQDFPYILEGDDGTGGCGTATNYCTAKLNSLGCLPSISLGGSVSASAGSGAPLSATNVIGNKNGLFFHSTIGKQAVAFHGGLLCVKPPLKRHAVANSGGTAGVCNGVFSEDFNAYIFSGADPALIAGASVAIQNWSRDPADPFTDSLSDATSVVICP
jgi:hypothetical protein